MLGRSGSVHTCPDWLIADLLLIQLCKFHSHPSPLLLIRPTLLFLLGSRSDWRCSLFSVYCDCSDPENSLPVMLLMLIGTKQKDRNKNMPVGETTFRDVTQGEALNNEPWPRLCFMWLKQDVALMSCLVFQSYYVRACLQSIKCSVWFIIKECSECVECTYSAALQKDNGNNNLCSILCQSF